MLEEDIEKGYQLKKLLDTTKADKKYIESKIKSWTKPSNPDEPWLSRLPKLTVSCTVVEGYLPEESNYEILKLVLKEITKYERKLRRELNSLLE